MPRVYQLKPPAFFDKPNKTDVELRDLRQYLFPCRAFGKGIYFNRALLACSGASLGRPDPRSPFIASSFRDSVLWSLAGQDELRPAGDSFVCLYLIAAELLGEVCSWT